MLIVGNQMEAPKQAGMAGGDFAFLDRHNSLLVKQSMRGCLQECMGCEATSEFNIATKEDKKENM